VHGQLPHNALGRFLIVPEIGPGTLRLEFSDLFSTGIEVKETSRFWKFLISGRL
jgi:hypothetical protein